jgi:hypothetical protein
MEDEMKYMIALFILLITVSISESYVLIKSTFSNAGNTSSSADYVLKDAIGQNVIGESKSTNYIEQAGFFTHSAMTQVGITEETEEKINPMVFSLSSPFPNPAIKMVTIEYGIPNLSHVSIRIYDITGRVIKTLIESKVESGFYTLSWDRKDDACHNIPNGVYFVRLETEKKIATRKLILVR